MDNMVFEGKTIFLTGGSGFLGTALVSRIVLSTSCPSLILLCRGGVSRLHQVWQGTLPPQIFARLRDDPRIEVVDGDICLKNMGLEQTTIAHLGKRVDLLIHAASSINLRHTLARIASVIVQGTLNVAEFALSCTNLERFVYISTAYANAHLHYINPKHVPRISERIYPLRDNVGLESDADAEWLCLQKYGTTPEFESTTFPWAYAYAKHLTERLLMGLFQMNERSATSSTSSLEGSSNFEGDQKLLIVRPSIIGPAETFPVPDWQVAFSAPVTGLLAFLVLTPAKRLTFYSQFPDPSREALIDEVPVDVVANRIIMHTDMGTSGIVHANRELSSCYRFTDYIRASHKLRRLPWNSKILWHSDSTSPKLCEVAKLYAVGGCTFDFSHQKTSDLWSTMRAEERETFPLFAAAKLSTDNEPDLSRRDAAFRRLFSAYFKKRQWPAWCLPVLYNNP